VIGVQCLLQHLAEVAALDEVPFRADTNLVAQQFGEKLGGDEMDCAQRWAKPN